MSEIETSETKVNIYATTESGEVVYCRKLRNYQSPNGLDIAVVESAWDFRNYVVTVVYF